MSRSPTSFFRLKLQMLHRTSWILFLFLIVLTCIRLVWGAFSELLPDEAYYYLWAQHPSVGYYSDGPGIAFSILVGTSIFGHFTASLLFGPPALSRTDRVLVGDNH